MTDAQKQPSERDSNATGVDALMDAAKPLAERFARLEKQFPNQLQSHLVQVSTESLRALAKTYFTLLADEAVEPIRWQFGGASAVLHGDLRLELWDADSRYAYPLEIWDKWFVDRVDNLRIPTQGSGGEWQKSVVIECNGMVKRNWGKCERFFVELRANKREMEIRIVSKSKG